MLNHTLITHDGKHLVCHVCLQPDVENVIIRHRKTEIAFLESWVLAWICKYCTSDRLPQLAAKPFAFFGVTTSTSENHLSFPVSPIRAADLSWVLLKWKLCLVLSQAQTQSGRVTGSGFDCDSHPPIASLPRSLALLLLCLWLLTGSGYGTQVNQSHLGVWCRQSKSVRHPHKICSFMMLLTAPDWTHLLYSSDLIFSPSSARCPCCLCAGKWEQ